MLFKNTFIAPPENIEVSIGDEPFPIRHRVKVEFLNEHPEIPVDECAFETLGYEPEPSMSLCILYVKGRAVAFSNKGSIGNLFLKDNDPSPKLIVKLDPKHAVVK